MPTPVFDVDLATGVGLETIVEKVDEENEDAANKEERFEDCGEGVWDEVELVVGGIGAVILK